MNKNILIVGGTSGIGHACLKALASDNHDIVSISRSKESINPFPNVSHYSLDICDQSADLSFLPSTIHSLIYCPGTINLKPFKSFSLNEFRDDFELNFIGLVRILQPAIEKLISAKNSSVVTFSTVAVSKGMNYHSSIASSKGAIEGLTRSLAAEYANSGIRFNSIALSLVNTPLANYFTRSSTKLESISKRHPLKRIGKPDEVASLVKYLVSDDSSWMTGQIIGLDGGLSSINALS